MPRFPPAGFIVQPYFATDRVEVAPGTPPTISGAGKCACKRVPLCVPLCMCADMLQ